MLNNVYIYALAAGLLMFVILEIDKRYFNKNEESNKYFSIRISLLVSMIVWGISAYQFNTIIDSVKSLKPMDSQKIMTDPFL